MPVLPLARVAATRLLVLSSIILRIQIAGSVHAILTDMLIRLGLLLLLLIKELVRWPRKWLPYRLLIENLTQLLLSIHQSVHLMLHRQ